MANLPEIFDNENGDIFWATGHIEPALMVAAVSDYLRRTLGAFFDPTDLLDVDTDHVSHTWYYDDGTDNDDSMHRCGPTKLDAQPFTELVL